MKDLLLEDGIYEFYSPSCQACVEQAKILNDNMNIFEEGVFHQLDFFTNKEIANQYNIRNTPTFIALIDGEETGRKTGLSNDMELTNWLDNIDFTHTDLISMN